MAHSCHTQTQHVTLVLPKTCILTSAQSIFWMHGNSEQWWLMWHFCHCSSLVQLAFCFKRIWIPCHASAIFHFWQKQTIKWAGKQIWEWTNCFWNVNKEDFANVLAKDTQKFTSLFHNAVCSTHKCWVAWQPLAFIWSKSKKLFKIIKNASRIFQACKNAKQCSDLLGNYFHILFLRLRKATSFNDFENEDY